MLRTFISIASAAAMLGSASAQELPPVPSNFDTSAWIVPAWGSGQPPSPQPSGETVGAFRFICNASHNNYDDPIVYPGKPGESHLHTFFGNTKADAHSTYESLRTTGDSSCQGGPLNRSAYWHPSLLDGNGNVIMPDHIAVYYKSIPGDRKIPRGLRYVFGYDARNPNAARQFHWNCDGPGATQSHSATLTARLALGCPAGAKVGVVAQSPDCWDGVNLDSPDHRSHMAYSTEWSKQVCPASHPVRIPQFTVGSWWRVEAGDDTSKWHLSSDMGQVPGSTFHSDWFGAWDDQVLATWHANCIDKKLNCSGMVLGNGKQGKAPAGFSWTANPRLVPVPARPHPHTPEPAPGPTPDPQPAPQPDPAPVPEPTPEPAKPAHVFLAEPYQSGKRTYWRIRKDGFMWVAGLSGTTAKAICVELPGCTVSE